MKLQFRLIARNEEGRIVQVSDFHTWEELEPVYQDYLTWDHVDRIEIENYFKPVKIWKEANNA